MDTEKQLVDAVLSLADDSQGPGGGKRLSCAQAFRLAKELKVQSSEIGRICNRHNVKIYGCQLGCFK